MTVQLRKNADTLAATDAVPVDLAGFAIKGGVALGSIILTARGEVAVEDLRVGDRIITRERGMATLRAITTVTSPACTIRADSLGLARPERDITVAADQHVAIRDWRADALFGVQSALVPAARLADGKQIAVFGETLAYQLNLGAPLTIYANGLETPTGRTEKDLIDLTADI
ncbi:Hint domain-containing protein [Jannaschia pohangensis]|uniref:Hint domain-containing protein n=1 Tax=Jannaschia pohangensis TaxID=390807 RepID=A0A1I3IHF5_9RHOB|nr:Hint domain-containing protein [Jannaschia pohangensis]SFI47414.1 Hint domain-containing protein [Jannaschia pohangensis]